MYNIYKPLILLCFSILLGACVDPGSDIQTYCRSNLDDPTNIDANNEPVKIGNIIHTYNPGEQIEYAVSGIVNGAPVSGALTVDWRVHAPLPKPVVDTGEVITDLLQESAEMNVPGLNKTTHRYIVQDSTPMDPQNTVSTKGTYKVWAFGNGEIGLDELLYWTNIFPEALNSVSNITYLKSPFDEDTLISSPLSEVITHYPMAGCEPGVNCGEKAVNYTEVYTIDSITADNKIVETIAGTFFEAYKIQISSATVNYVGFENTRDSRFPVDFRHICSTGPNGAPINFDGTMWMYPQVGIIKYQINCISGQDSYNLTFDFKNTNITLPASVSGDQSAACN